MNHDEHKLEGKHTMLQGCVCVCSEGSLLNACASSQKASRRQSFHIRRPTAIKCYMVSALSEPQQTVWSQLNQFPSIHPVQKKHHIHFICKSPRGGGVYQRGKKLILGYRVMSLSQDDGSLSTLTSVDSIQWIY